MTEEDLAAHKCDWIDPISVEYRGYELHEIPPNGQGIAALVALGILRNFDLASHPVDSADSLHLQIEAMKLAFADVWANVSDPATMRVTTEEMLDPAYLAARARTIDMKRAQDHAAGIPKGGGTVYLTTADEKGMMLSFIQSNYMGFGSGIVVPGTGISLQNRGHGFSLQRGHPNEVGPRKRPFQTIIPGFLTRGGEPVMSFGVMGGNMQPQGHIQMVTRLVDYQQNPQACSDGPRWIVNHDLTVSLEDDVRSSVKEELAKRGHPHRAQRTADVRLRRRAADPSLRGRVLRGIRSPQGRLRPRLLVLGDARRAFGREYDRAGNGELLLFPGGGGKHRHALAEQRRVLAELETHQHARLHEARTLLGAREDAHVEHPAVEADLGVGHGDDQPVRTFRRAAQHVGLEEVEERGARLGDGGIDGGEARLEDREVAADRLRDLPGKALHRRQRPTAAGRAHARARGARGTALVHEKERLAIEGAVVPVAESLVRALGNVAAAAQRLVAQQRHAAPVLAGCGAVHMECRVRRMGCGERSSDGCHARRLRPMRRGVPTRRGGTFATRFPGANRTPLPSVRLDR
jgi:hypothetical protein